MVNKKQREIFIESEGDNYNLRNKVVLQEKIYDESDLIINAITKINNSQKISHDACVLEIGSGQGGRLAWIQTKLGLDVNGLDPAATAVKFANSRGVSSKIGTADYLPYPDNSFDITIFGFCLYLCDIEDLFKIAYEANRVTKAPGWIIIYDFYSTFSRTVKYKHHELIKTHKMDFKSLFSWHPNYNVYDHHIFDHTEQTYTDDKENFVSLSVLRKS